MVFASTFTKWTHSADAIGVTLVAKSRVAFIHLFYVLLNFLPYKVYDSEYCTFTLLTRLKEIILILYIASCIINWFDVNIELKKKIVLFISYTAVRKMGVNEQRNLVTNMELHFD